LITHKLKGVDGILLFKLGAAASSSVGSATTTSSLVGSRGQSSIIACSTRASIGLNWRCSCHR
jgi:hypothetical protein